MIVGLTSTWLPGQQGTRGRADDDPFRSMSQPARDVPGLALASPENDDRYLMAVAESMLRAGYGQREIERALKRMSPSVSTDSGRIGIFRSLRRVLARRGRTARRRSTQPVSEKATGAA
jgi:hypothetical protein